MAVLSKLLERLPTSVSVARWISMLWMLSMIPAGWCRAVCLFVFRGQRLTAIFMQKMR